VCVCVCVCERERERDCARGGQCVGGSPELDSEKKTESGVVECDGGRDLISCSLFACC
jgi:general stress protein YciG